MPPPAAERGSATVTVATAAALLLLLLAVIAGAVGGITGQEASACTAQPAASSTAASIPANYLADFKKAGTEYGIPWTVLAAIGEGGKRRRPNDGPSSAGALGPMQFEPSTWALYGDGGNIMDPADAIPAAARLLVANGAPGNLQQAIFGFAGLWSPPSMSSPRLRRRGKRSRGRPATSCGQPGSTSPRKSAGSPTTASSPHQESNGCRTSRATCGRRRTAYSGSLTTSRSTAIAWRRSTNSRPRSERRLPARLARKRAGYWKSCAFRTSPNRSACAARRPRSASEQPSSHRRNSHALQDESAGV